MSRRLRRQVRMSFGLEPDLGSTELAEVNRHKAARLVRPVGEARSSRRRTRAKSPRASIRCGSRSSDAASERSDNGACLWTVEVEHVLETPSHSPPKAAELFHAIEKDDAIIDRTRRCVRIDGAFSHSSKRPQIGTETATENHLPGFLAWPIASDGAPATIHISPLDSR